MHDPADGACSSLVPKSAEENVESCDKELDIKEPGEDGSVVSVLVLPQTYINCATSGGSQSLVGTNINSAVIDKDQGLHSGVPAAATVTSGSMPLGDGINKLDPACQSKDDRIFSPTNNPILDEYPASDNISKGPADYNPTDSIPELPNHTDTLVPSEYTQSLPVSGSNSINAGECQHLQNAEIQLASAVGPDEVPEEDSGKSNSISGITKSTDDETGKGIVDEHGTSTPDEVPGKVVVNEHDTNTPDEVPGEVVINEHETSPPDEVPVSTSDFHVDHSAITAIEEVRTELDSEKGILMSSLTASSHASTNPMAVASPDQLAPFTLCTSIAQATEKDISEPSAGQVPEGRLLIL